MKLLEYSRYGSAYSAYQSCEAYFPIIAAVIERMQDGIIFADDLENPRQFYVEHAFGFAQVFGYSIPDFERSLQGYLFKTKNFHSTKVRLYTPDCPGFLNNDSYKSLISFRQHFKLDSHRKVSHPIVSKINGKNLTTLLVDDSNVDIIETSLGVVGRFWRTSSDFVKNSNGVVAFVDGEAASICYAAAVSAGMAEIDVLTLPQYRHLGIAKGLVSLFNDHCLAQDLLPLWDCFTNNMASMALCNSMGFVPLGEPYPFFTINR